jgi:hypothetical protein
VHVHRRDITRGKHGTGTSGSRGSRSVLVQIEQLHSATCARSAVMRNRTRPQWRPPSNVLMRAAEK